MTPSRIVPAVLAIAVLAATGCTGGGEDSGASGATASTTAADAVDALRDAANATIDAGGARTATLRLYAGRGDLVVFDLAGTVDFASNTATFQGTYADVEGNPPLPANVVMADGRVLLTTDISPYDDVAEATYELVGIGVPGYAGDPVSLGLLDPAEMISIVASATNYTTTNAVSTDGEQLTVFTAKVNRFLFPDGPMLFRYSADTGGSMRAVIADGYLRQAEYVITGDDAAGGSMKLRLSVGSFGPVDGATIPATADTLTGYLAE